MVNYILNGCFEKGKDLWSRVFTIDFLGLKSYASLSFDSCQYFQTLKFSVHELCSCGNVTVYLISSPINCPRTLLPFKDPSFQLILFNKKDIREICKHTVSFKLASASLTMLERAYVSNTCLLHQVRNSCLWKEFPVLSWADRHAGSWAGSSVIAHLSVC